MAVLEQVVEFDMRAWEPGKGWVQLPSPVSTEEASGVEITLKQNTANGSPESIRYVLSLE
ncbi:hypothetical protein L1889_10325 [Paenalcaligenes niemegkensis]|uniref:hypothetical protein n=1 Tax=Paenalcaligenes niemegkensis TaxID=2895469 RepID=UPI001EE844DD|nr:hypothetical protein [Paenalcaligenes niemegkensis]MCQ9617049.1 hypothetical protein [Paenalcaligenes niemegkensis]